MTQLQSFKELIVWQKSMNLVEKVYRISKNFPQQEQYGLTSQMRRAAVSISSNIAEGYGRKSSKEYGQFYSISYGSLLELHTQILICERLELINLQELTFLMRDVDEISKMLHTMILKAKS